MDEELLEWLNPSDPETDGKTIHVKVEWEGELLPIRWKWCALCEGAYVECRCGNNLCSGGAYCEDCSEYYKIQDYLYKNKQVPTREHFVNKVEV